MDISWSIGPADNAWVFTLLFVVWLVWFLWPRFTPTDTGPRDWMPEYPPPKPAPAAFAPPEVEPVTQWPFEVQQALLELVAFTHNQGTPMMNFNLKDLSANGVKLPGYRITIERIDD